MPPRGGKGDAPSDRRHRRWITIMWGASSPTPRRLCPRANPRPARRILTSWRRAKPLHSVLLPCSSCCVAPIFFGWRTPPEGNPAFLRHVACLAGRVLAGSQIRTVMLSQWVPEAGHGLGQRKAALCNAAGHSGARQAKHKANTAVVSRMVRWASRCRTGAAGAQRVRRPHQRRRPEARIDK